MSLSTTPIQNQYVQQLADDLAKNTEEQEKARAQAEEAQHRLTILEQEHTWLQTMRAQATASQAATAAEMPAFEASSVTPATGEATAKAPVKAARVRRTTAKPRTETAEATDAPVSADILAENNEPEAAEPAEATPAPADTPKKRAARKPAAKKTAKTVPGQRATATKAAPAERIKRGPSLAELVAPLLSADTPRSAKEILAALKEHHPERSTSDQLVRNAINTLISRGRAQRLQQQSSVFYTAASPMDEALEAAAH